MLYDRGPEYGAVWEDMLSIFSIIGEPISAESQWKNGIAERHGSNIKFMMLKTMHGCQCSTKLEIQEALIQELTPRLEQEIRAQVERELWEQFEEEWKNRSISKVL